MTAVRRPAHQRNPGQASAAARRRAARRRTRRRTIALAVGAIAVVVAVVAVLARPEGPGPVPVERPAAAYRVSYRLTVADAPVLREERTVRRPYESRVLSWRGDDLVGGRITNLEGTWQYSPDAGGWRLVERGRRRAAQDFRPLLAAAADTDDRVSVAGVSAVAGRPCTRLRSGSPLGDPLAAPTDADRVELCVDASGVPLRQVWRHNGRVVQQLEATALDLDPALDDGTFRADPQLDPIPEGSASRPVVFDLDPARAAGLAVEVRPPRPFREDGGIERAHVEGDVVTDVVQHWVAGARLVVVEHRYPSTPEPCAGKVLTASSIPGCVVVDFAGTTVTLDAGDGTSVRIWAADAKTAVAVARTARARPNPPGD